MKRFAGMLICLMLISWLAGCMYPNEMRGGAQSTPRESIALVQSAVNHYKELTGVLPIKNFQGNTPLYERYVVDFRKMIERGVIGQLPHAAYEQGGAFYFVIINPETNMEVKMLDIVMMQKVADVQRAVDQYRAKTYGELPATEEFSEKWYQIDYDKIGIDPVQFTSPYSTQKLGLIMHITGMVAVDYAPEIMKLIHEQGIEAPETREDLRYYLVDQSYFVPVKSVPYRWKNGEPVPEPLP